MATTPEDDLRHPRAMVEEWVFAAWSPDAAVGLVSGHRIVGRRAWYWAAVARADRPLLHVLDPDVPVRADPFVIKGEQMWAEHTCEAPLEQWTVGNETYAAALDDPDDALDRAYGHPTPIAFDLEWYAIEGPSDLAGGAARPDRGAYRQRGVAHGAVEILGEASIGLVEWPAERWHRWAVGLDDLGGAPPVPVVAAHTGVRAPFRLPDGSIADWVLTSGGWCRRPDGSSAVSAYRS